MEYHFNYLFYGKWFACLYEETIQRQISTYSSMSLTIRGKFNGTTLYESFLPSPFLFHTFHCANP